VAIPGFRESRTVPLQQMEADSQSARKLPLTVNFLFCSPNQLQAEAYQMLYISQLPQ